MRTVRADGQQAAHDQGRVLQAERRVRAKLMKKMLAFIRLELLLSPLFSVPGSHTLGPGQWHFGKNESHHFPVWPLRGPPPLGTSQWSWGALWWEWQCLCHPFSL